MNEFLVINIKNGLIRSQIIDETKHMFNTTFGVFFKHNNTEIGNSKIKFIFKGNARDCNKIIRLKG